MLCKKAYCAKKYAVQEGDMLRKKIYCIGKYTVWKGNILQGRNTLQERGML